MKLRHLFRCLSCGFECESQEDAYRHFAETRHEGFEVRYDSDED